MLISRSTVAPGDLWVKYSPKKKGASPTLKALWAVGAVGRTRNQPSTSKQAPPVSPTLLPWPGSWGLEKKNRCCPSLLLVSFRVLVLMQKGLVSVVREVLSRWRAPASPIPAPHSALFPEGTWRWLSVVPAIIHTLLQDFSGFQCVIWLFPLPFKGSSL